MAEKKKILGSIAVDSQTGVEHYDVPKSAGQQAESVQPSSASAPPSGITPNYKEKKFGETQNLAGVPDEFMNLFEHDPSEVILKQALKHPIGLGVIYTTAICVTLFVVVGGLLLLADNSMLEGMGISAAGKALAVLALFVIGLLIIGISFAASIVYRKSRMILTNQKVVFIRYHSLFSREISQLNIGEVEDVNVAQHSIWDRIFKMGSITIETAGEQNNYTFSNVGEPHDFARLTIQAHEGSIAEYGN